MNDAKVNSEGVEVAEDTNTDNSTEATKQTKGNTIPEELEVGKQKIATSNSLSTIKSTDISTLDYTDFSTPGRMLALGEVLVNSGMCPLKKPADVVVALLAGRDLGLPFITSISNIYPINGKPTIGVHIMKGIALKNGITYYKTRNYEKLYEFVEVDESGKPVIEIKKIGGKEAKVPVIVEEGFLDEQPQNTKKRYIDIVTEYELTRFIKLPNGTLKEMKARGSFSLREAQRAELSDKDNWKKYPKRMLEARAFSNAMKEIADDLVHGMMTPDEMSNGNYIEDVNGTVVQ